MGSIEKEEAALSLPWREAKKAVVKQHLRDVELNQVRTQIEGSPLEEDTFELSKIEEQVPDESNNASGLELQDLQHENDDPETFDPLEEW